MRFSAIARFCSLVGLSALVLLINIVAAAADKRVALVIGNADYEKVGRLNNPLNDTAAITALLRKAEFDEIKTYNNLTLRQMRAAIADFMGLARDADTAVVYYSGHGMEMDGNNYLIPVDATLNTDEDVPYEAYSLENLLRGLEPVSRLRLVILDACRDNPFIRSMRRSSRAIGRGFAPIELTRVNTLVAYAAKAGSYALDGGGKNSPYATALLNNLATPGLDLRIAFGGVRDDVLNATGNRQEPWLYGSLGRETQSLVRAPSAPAPPIAVGPSEAERAWALAKDTTSEAVLEDFIRRFGNSFYSALARERLESLRKKESLAVISPPSLTQTPDASCGSASLASVNSRAPRPLSASEECSLKPKDVFKECDQCPEMVVVPAKSFVMGSPSNDSSRYNDEEPQHSVNIPRPFAVGKFHVTVEQFALFAAEVDYQLREECTVFESGKWEDNRPGRSWRNPGFSQSGLHPVVCVNWDDARAHSEWLSRKTGKEYRLLSEGEWEYAARAGTTTHYFFGDDEKQLCHYANGTGLSCSDRHEYTAPVGSYTPNAFGLHDMYGNAWQWVEDCWHENYAGAPSDGTAWTSTNCDARVLRGGSWLNLPRWLRSAVRIKRAANARISNNGFRVARVLNGISLQAERGR
jgi:formylglycine-generating enzyme required for sulfatase activity/uncharacterized caspase-like protein